MRTRSVALVAVILGLLASAWYAAHRRTNLTVEIAAANRQRAAADARIRRATVRRAQAIQERATLESELRVRREPPRPSPSPAEAPRHIPTIAERLRTEPDAQVLWLKLEHARAEKTYGPLFRHLGLTPAQIAQFKDNVAKKSEQQMDLGAIETEEKMKSGSVSAATADAMRQIQPQYEAAQRAVLGDAGAQALKEYERTTHVRNWVDGWAGGATVNLGEPISAEQGEQLVQILANASESYRQGGIAIGKIDWVAADAAAQRILTPAQYQFFTTTEPPLPTGGRFQSELYRNVSAASETEKKLSASQ